MLIIAFVLPSVLFATGPLLAGAGVFLLYTAHATAISIITVLPSYLATRRVYSWACVGVAAIAGACGLWFAFHYDPYLKIALRLNPDPSHFSLITFTLMAASGVLAVAFRTSYRKRRWLLLSCEILGYLIVLIGAFVLSYIPLYGVE